jgi:hypothetical protein
LSLGLRQSKLVPRKPYDLKGTATNAAAIQGFLQLVKRRQFRDDVSSGGDTVYLWDGSTSIYQQGNGKRFLQVEGLLLESR